MTRKQVTLFGAGLVSSPVIDTLLANYDVFVVDKNIPSTHPLRTKYSDNEHLRYSQQDVNDTNILAGFVKGSDLIISLLPPTMHPTIAKLCLHYGRNMLTASYVSKDMLALDREAKEKNIILLNECGLDPGIDHMSSMQLFDKIHTDGGKILSFKSYCGGLPSDPLCNPLGYQLSWSPSGVFSAVKNGARFFRNNNIEEISAGNLFKLFELIKIPDIPRESINSEFEMYYNRDSMDYIPRYNLQDEVQTFMRGTLRYPGWCETIQAMADLGYLDPHKKITGKTYAEVFSDAPIQDTDSYSSAANRVTEKLGTQRNNVEAIVQRLEWLGCFDTHEIPDHVGRDLVAPSEEDTAFATLVSLANRLMRYKVEETDLVLLYHDVTSGYFDDRRQRHQLLLKMYGESGGYSAMAKTVGLPIAFTAELLLENKINDKGVLIPTSREIYEPVLKKLDKAGIRFLSMNV